MDTFTLVQYILSIATFIVGLINFFRSSDGIGLKISGLISMGLGVCFFLLLYFDYPVIIQAESSQLHVLSTLSISVYFAWSLFTAMLAIVSIRPTWFNLKNIILSLHPILIVSFIAIINCVFIAGQNTQDQTSDVLVRHRPEIVLRYIWFLIALVYGIWHIYWPFLMLPKIHNRRPTRFLYFNQLLLVIGLIAFLMAIFGNIWSQLYQTTLVTITLLSSISFFWKDAFSIVNTKQLNIKTADEAEGIVNLNMDISEKQLRLERAAKMLELFKTNELLQNQDFSWQDLADIMKLDKSTTQDIIQLLGYAGFNEMIVNIKCDRFKEIAHAQINRGETPKMLEITFEVGFLSFDRFAKVFKNLNDYSPEQYIERLKSNPKLHVPKI